jgi:sugar phosphate isomerase/epimerase
MKLGVMSAAFPKWSLEEVVKWSSESGFETLEVCCWPAGEDKLRKYGGIVHIDVDSLSPGRVDEIKGLMADNNQELSVLGYYPNALHPDPTHRSHVVNHLKKVITGARKLGVGVVSTFIGRTWDTSISGRDWQKDLDFNFEQLMLVWPDIIKLAVDNDVKIAIEHCPMLWADTWPGGSNLPHSPALLNRMFDAIPDDNLGICLDPSHLIWQQIDSTRFIKDFGSRIFHVHAKDMAIDEDMFYQDGILGCGFRWQIPRLPGQGLIDWRVLMANLYEAGYDFVLCIEHEDHNWEGSDELVKRGFMMAKQHLAPFVA